MKCRCGGDTAVADTRPHASDPTVTVRKRRCLSCGERFTTQEGTVDIVSTRRRAADRAKRWRAQNPDKARADQRLYRKVADEAKARGVSLQQVRDEWGVSINPAGESDYPTK